MSTDPLTPRRNTGLWFTLDANRINARQLDKEMNKLELWHDNGVIDLMISEPAAQEALAGGSPERFKKDRKYFHPQTLASTQEEFRLIENISHCLFGRHWQNKNEEYDVAIAFNAKKYAGSLITEDGLSKRQPIGILGRKNELKSLGIQVYRTSEAIAWVEKRIRARDRRAMLWAQETGQNIPEWVGKD